MHSTDNQISLRRLEPIAAYLSLIALSASTVSVVVWVLGLCHYGIDFTDEGYYLNWISNPWNFPASHTQFGFVYHPLYLLVDGNIALLRQINVLLTLGIAWLAFFVFFRIKVVRPSSEGSSSILPFIPLSLVLASSALSFLYFWLPTPNYNSLALQSLLVATIGATLVHSDTARIKLMGHFVIGLAGWMAFMAKPTTAVALGLTVVIARLVARNLKVRGLWISAAVFVVLFLISAWVIDGSIRNFLLRLAMGAEDLHRLQGRYSFSEILRIDTFHFSRSESALFFADTILVGISTFLILSGRLAGRWFSILLTLSAAVVCLSISTELFHPKLATSAFLGLQYCAIPLGTLIALILTRSPTLGTPNWRDTAIFVVTCAVLPFVLVFGTNNNYFAASTGGAVFWVLAGVALIAAKPVINSNNWQSFLAMAAIAQAGTVAILFISSEAPYRQFCPLHQNTHVICLPGGSQLKVSRDSAQYIRDLNRMALNGGFEVGSPVIDLTGHFPTALYALGAKPVGLAWLIGGYQGSEAMLSAVLDRVAPKELQRAWVLTEPEGPRKHSVDILRRHGIQIDTDYVEVGTINTPKADDYPKSFQQHLLKPKAKPAPVKGL